MTERTCIKCGRKGPPNDFVMGDLCLRCDTKGGQEDMTDDEIDAMVRWQRMEPGAKLPRSMFETKTAEAHTPPESEARREPGYTPSPRSVQWGLSPGGAWFFRLMHDSPRRTPPGVPQEKAAGLFTESEVRARARQEGLRGDAVKRALERARQEGRRAVQRKMAFFQTLVESPEDAQSLRTHQTVGSSLGTLAGGALGGLAGGRRLGLLGAAGGGLAGAMVGGLPGKALGTLTYDLGKRTGGRYDKTLHYLDAASGDNMRIAAAMPSATDFVEFAQQDDTGPPEPNLSGFEADLDERMKPPGWGGPSPLEGGDAATRNEQMGLTQYGGV